MRRLLVATRNRGKVSELARMFADLDVELVGLDAWPDAPEVEETGATFEENALIKARAYARFSGLPALADDSGIEVDALGGAPGIHSARYAGEHGDDEANNARLLRELEQVEDRAGRVRCALAFVDLESGREHVAHGVIEGTILRAPRGDGGFGYDPLFLPRGETRTTAEMSAEEKDAISHRAEAARAMRAFLGGVMGARDGGEE